MQLGDKVRISKEANHHKWSEAWKASLGTNSKVWAVSWARESITGSLFKASEAWACFYRSPLLHSSSQRFATAAFTLHVCMDSIISKAPAFCWFTVWSHLTHNLQIQPGPNNTPIIFFHLLQQQVWLIRVKFVSHVKLHRITTSFCSFGINMNCTHSWSCFSPHCCYNEAVRNITASLPSILLKE